MINNAVKIVVDADACPQSALQICFQLGPQYQIEVWTVASFNHQIRFEHHIIVGNASQEADLKILNLAQAGDIVVTQDFGLTAMVLGKGAYAIGPKGQRYDPETIDFFTGRTGIKSQVQTSRREN